MLNVKEVYIKGRPEPLKDRQVFVNGHFLIVDNDGAPPTWYSVSMIERLEGVIAGRGKITAL